MSRELDFDSWDRDALLSQVKALDSLAERTEEDKATLRARVAELEGALRGLKAIVEQYEVGVDVAMELARAETALVRAPSTPPPRHEHRWTTGETYLQVECMDCGAPSTPPPAPGSGECDICGRDHSVETPGCECGHWFPQNAEHHYDCPLAPTCPRAGKGDAK